MAVKVRVDKNTLGPTGSFEQVMNTPRFLVGDVDEAAPPPPRRSGHQRERAIAGVPDVEGLPL